MVLEFNGTLKGGVSFSEGILSLIFFDVEGHRPAVSPNFYWVAVIHPDIILWDIFRITETAFPSADGKW